ncbi:hypothetical protein CCHR01_08327 [Colletotrichum chrysophilum]|uniref:Uncharacterized protein n=1 Tax=Colletotrichum chrysophilum TaxID=1836956 RepID=A0AAD9ELK5_9PEZI|nr:hypothetical protein CCHR01_08327 [Colletotrichum chrysophilum]
MVCARGLEERCPWAGYLGPRSGSSWREEKGMGMGPWAMGMGTGMGMGMDTADSGQDSGHGRAAAEGCGRLRAGRGI